MCLSFANECIKYTPPSDIMAAALKIIVTTYHVMEPTASDRGIPVRYSQGIIADMWPATHARKKWIIMSAASASTAL